MIAILLAPFLALARAWRTTLPVCVLLAALDYALGAGWVARWDPGTLTGGVWTPAFLGVLFGWPVLRALVLLFAARAVAGHGAPASARLLGVAWAQLVIHGVTLAAMLVFSGLWTPGVSRSRLDVAALALAWSLGNGMGDIAPFARLDRWGLYATHEPAAYVLGRVGHPGLTWPQDPRLSLVVTGFAAAGLARLVPVLFATGVVTDAATSPALWAGALLVAGAADLLAVSTSVVARAPEP